MTNYEKCFGTPEKAAETILHECEEATTCGACPIAFHPEYCGDPLKWLNAEEREESGCADCEIE